MTAARGWCVAASLVVALCGCHQKPAQPTAADVAKTSEAARDEVAQARVEAARDVQSALKVGSVNPKEVAVAKATATYDVAMAKADGDHKVALEQCLTLPADRTTTCKDQADADYDAAKGTAKAARARHL